MARSARGENYLRVRRWVDRDLAAYPRDSLALWGPTGIAILALVGAYNAGPAEPVAVALFWLLIAPPWGAWMGFLLWRASRIIRFEAIKGDREYDQRGKFLLPPEYARSESVAAASRRERRRKLGRTGR